MAKFGNKVKRKGWNWKQRGKTQTERRNGEQKHVVRVWWWTGTRDLGLQNQWFPNFQ